MSDQNNPSKEEIVKSFVIVIAAIIGGYFFYQWVQNDSSGNTSNAEIEQKDTKDEIKAEDQTRTEETTEAESGTVNETESSTSYADCPKCGSIYNPRSWGEMCPKCWKNGEALKCPHGNIDSPKFCDMCYPS